SPLSMWSPAASCQEEVLPPRTSRFSISSTVIPASISLTAVARPASPPPIINVFGIFVIFRTYAVGVLAGARGPQAPRTFFFHSPVAALPPQVSGKRKGFFGGRSPPNLPTA